MNKNENGKHDDFEKYAELSICNKRLFAEIASQYAGKNVLIINDEDTKRDLRVLNQYHCFTSENCNVEVIDLPHYEAEIRQGSIASLFKFVETSCFFLKCLFAGIRDLARWRAVTTAYDVTKYRNPVFGKNPLSAFYDLKTYYLGSGFPLEKLKRRPDVVVANNISSLMFCEAAFGSLDVDLIYDAHELSFMRFRRDMSTLRNWFGFCYEVSLGKKPKRVLTVNRPLQEIYSGILARDDVGTCCNNLYKDIAGQTVPEGELFIAFFGSARDYRLLHRLSALARYRKDINIRFYAVGDQEKQAKFIEDLFEGVGQDRIKLHFGIDYQQALEKEVMNGGIWMSWCAVEDACLSYRLSLPNKVIQSARAGMPFIVVEGTYISDIAKKYALGVSLKADGSVEDDDRLIEGIRKNFPRKQSFHPLLESFDLNAI